MIQLTTDLEYSLKIDEVESNEYSLTITEDEDIPITIVEEIGNNTGTGCVWAKVEW